MKNAIVGCLLAALAGTASADAYDVTVSRKDSNVYAVSGKDVVIHTRYCYVYAYSEDAILKTSGYGGDLIFLDSREKCDVKAVYGASTQNPGKYRVSVSRQDDNWYEVFGTNMFIRTSMCLELALGDDAILVIRSSVGGTLIFNNGSSCVVQQVYTKMRL